MKKLLPVLLALLGTAAGIGAGLFLAPAPKNDAPHESASGASAETAAHGDDTAETRADTAQGSAEMPTDTEYVKLNNQFVVPVVSDSRVAALVVVSISLEVPTGNAPMIFEQEPKLRDAFLRTLFDHANIGGFDGNFTQTARMDTLRRVLFETARNLLGSQVLNVLITDIARQDN